MTLGPLSASVQFTAIWFAGAAFPDFTVKKGSEQNLFLNDSSKIEKEEIQIVANVVEIDDKSISDLVKSQLDAEKRLKEAAETIGQLMEKEQIVRKHAEAEADKEKGCRQESEAKVERLAAEVDRLQTLMNAGSDQAAERECHLTRSAVKIQSKWRQVSTRWQVLRERSERDWRLQQAKRVRAISCLQSLWRLKQKKCQRRWLRAQNGCFNAETPYDAVLASMTLLTSISFTIIFGCFCSPPAR